MCELEPRSESLTRRLPDGLEGAGREGKQGKGKT
jgi:hypothetical protein